MTDSLTIRRPDDWHLHFRDGAIMREVVPYTARQFARAIVMPNLTPPVTTTALATAYRERILAAVPEGVRFTPLMTCYLTDNTDPDDLARGAATGVFTAAKLYPANATTNSAAGVTNVEKLYPVLARMEAEDIVLCIHGEVTDHHVDVFDREKEFIERHLRGIVASFPRLRVVFEHITTSDAVDFVLEAGPQVAATITPQHLHINRNAMLVGGIQPHNYCLPVAKRETHRLALRAAATSGSAKFFPRHRQRPASSPRQGKRLRMRGHFRCALRARKLYHRVRRGRRARCVRGLCLAPRSGLLQAAGQRRDRNAGTRRTFGAADAACDGRGNRALPWRRNAGMALRRLGSAPRRAPLCQQVVDKDRHGESRSAQSS